MAGERKIDFWQIVLKWLVPGLGMLVVAGAVALANRDMYTKPQIDEKVRGVKDRVEQVDKRIDERFLAEREWSNAQDQAIMRNIENQNKAIDKRLQLIREDQQEIKRILQRREN